MKAILIVICTLLFGALLLQEEHVSVLNVQIENCSKKPADTVYVEIHDTVYIETKVTDVKPDYVDFSPFIGKKLSEISDESGLGLSFYAQLTDRLMSRGYLPSEGAWTHRMIHDAYKAAMLDYEMDETISEDMLIIFGMYTY